MVNNAKKEANKDYFAVSDGVEVIYLEGQNEAGKEDPSCMVEHRKRSYLCKEHRETINRKRSKEQRNIKKNLAAYVEKLEALDKDAKQRIAKIPEENV